MEDFYAVIMAGGGGTRLWPLSRRSRPKQLLRLLGDRSLFQMAVDRLLPLLGPERIYVVTIEQQAVLLQEQAPQLPAENYLLEPAPKGTASVVGLAAAVLQAQDSECVMACLTADHLIRNEEAFRSSLRATYEVARLGHLVTLGVTPTYAATGYGYLQIGKSLDLAGVNAFEVASFREKPDLATAQDYLAAGTYFWNSGMFVWRVDAVLREIRRQLPQLFQAVETLGTAVQDGQLNAVLPDVWQALTPETIDYGIMEDAQNVAMIPADDLDWWDIGGWDRLFEVFEKDPAGNLVLAPSALALETHGSLLFQSAGESKRLIAAYGIEDLIVVDMDDVLFLCPRERAEEVRELVRKLESSDHTRYL